MKSKFLMRASAGAIIACVMPFHADAQSNHIEMVAEESTASNDIVVTARRREERLQDVPVSVTAWSAKDLEQRHIVSRTDLSDNTPSLITISGGYPKEYGLFALRGQGPAFASAPGVVPYFAEVANAITMDGRTGSFYDMANIQVLAGPQGTLFGKNATGGNILFEPVRPHNGVGGYARVEYGNYDNRRFDGAFNVPIVEDKILLRFAGEIGRRDGYTHDVGPKFAGRRYDNLKYQSGRISLIIRPFEGLENYTVARFYHSDNNGPGTVLTDYNIDARNPLAPSQFIRTVFPSVTTAVAVQKARGIRHVAYDLDQFSTTFYRQLTNTTTLALSDNLKLKNIFSASHFCQRYGYDYDAMPVQIGGQRTEKKVYPATRTNTIFECNVDQQYLVEELQLQGSAADGALIYSIGGYYDRVKPEKGNLLESYNYPTFLLGGPVTSYSYRFGNSHALFGQATYKLGHASSALEGFSITAGYRYTWEKQAVQAFTIAPPTSGGEAKFDYGSYTFNLDYQPSRDMLVYIAARSAYKTGGINGAVPATASFRSYAPEKLSDIEIGFKSEFSLGGMPTRLNVAAYSGQYKNIQRTTNELIGSAILNVVRSAAAGRIKGIEVTGSLEPVKNLTLTGNYSGTDSKYTKIVNTAEATLLGAPFPFTPKTKYSLGARYEIPLSGDAGTIGFSANYAYQGKFSTSQNNRNRVDGLPGYGLLNLRADWNEIAGRPIDLGLFATNVTQKKYAHGIFDSYNGGLGFLTLTYGEPRMYGVQLRYRFTD